MAEAFVQVLDGVTGQTAYHPFGLSDFRAETHSFDVRVGANGFSSDGIVVDVPGLGRRSPAPASRGRERA